MNVGITDVSLVPCLKETEENESINKYKPLTKLTKSKNKGLHIREALFNK